MKTLQTLFIALLFGLVCMHSASASDFNALAAYATYEPAARTIILQDTADAAVQAGIQDAASGFSASTLWALTEKAGPLRWPIFAVFVIGIFLVCFKLFELLADQRESRELENLEFRSMSLQQIIRTISGQRESMMSRLHAIILNVYQSNQAKADLHDEIANYVRFQQDRFDTFRRRVDFLADTAGALGLLGTVWGIFTVFSQGLLDDQVILTGMGFALITTLLGLIVSIFLNLSSTEIFSLFNRRLDRIAEKSDELRFRLMELVTIPPVNEDTLIDGMPVEPTFTPVVTPKPLPIQAEPVEDELEEDEEVDDSEEDAPPVKPVVLPSVVEKKTPQTAPDKPMMPPKVQVPVAEAKPIAQVEAVFEDRFSNNNYGDAATAIRKPLIDSKVDHRPEPYELQLTNAVREDTVGKKLKNMCLRLVDENGDGIPSHPVAIKVLEGDGLLNDAQQEVLLKTDNKGEVRFDWQLAKKTGKQAIGASVPGSDAADTRLMHAIITKPGVPRKLKQFGNNQGGPAGEILSKPLKVQVLDEFENPIPEWPVMFAVELGGGSFESGKTEIKVKTNANGDGIASLRVGGDPGFNTVKAAVEGVVKELKFQAMSMA